MPSPSDALALLDQLYCFSPAEAAVIRAKIEKASPEGLGQIHAILQEALRRQERFLGQMIAQDPTTMERVKVHAHDAFVRVKNAYEQEEQSAAQGAHHVFDT